MKTKEEVENLKANWRDDPCWNVEDTRGFEEHKDELLAYRVLCESERAEKRRIRLSELSGKLGIPGNTKLTEYVERLEHRIEELEKRLDKIEKKD
jgi:hypothetical protein